MSAYEVALQYEQQQKCLQTDVQQQLYIEGISDGALGVPLPKKYQYNLKYLEGYMLGLGQWTSELQRREELEQEIITGQVISDELAELYF